MQHIQKPARVKASRLFLVIGLLIFFSLACNLPLMAQSSQGADETARIEISVRETLIAIERENTENDDEQPTQDPDPVPPSETPEPEISDTPTLTPTATDTPTPEMAMIYASANTNCRKGQGTSFGWLVTMQEGEESEVVGVDPTGDYWYIRRPDNQSQFCWLWGKYATPSGPWESLPVYTPMPTPTPGLNYKLTFHNVTHCVGNSYVQFQIDNIGSIPLESWKSSGTDNSGGIGNLPFDSDTFFYHNNCPTTQTQNDLEPGEGSYLNVTFFSDPTGHDLTVNIKVCTKNGLAGDCLKKTFDIKP